MVCQIGKLAKYGNPFINKTLRTIGNYLQKCYYFYFLSNVLFGSSSGVGFTYIYYHQAYIPNECPQYYVFQNFEHHVKNNTKAGNDSEIDEFRLRDCFFNNPMYFLFSVLCGHVIPTLICLSWFYTMDRRYGVLKLKNNKITSKLRTVNIIFQAFIILLLVPLNLITAAFTTYIFIPFVLFIAISKWLFNCKCMPSTFIDKFLKCFIKDSEVLFLYLIYLLQLVIKNIGSAVDSIADAIEYNFKFTLKDWIKLMDIALTIYLLFNVYANRQHFKIFVETFNRVLPLMLSIWCQGDVILDAIQTKKYYELAYKNDTYSNDGRNIFISPLYFYFSLISFIMPVILSILLQLYLNRGFNMLKRWFGEKPQDLSFAKKIIFNFAKIMLEVPIYFISSVIFYYVVIPVVLINHGLKTIRTGINDDLNVDIDPCKIFSKLFNCTGILDFYGLKNFKSKSIPLLTGFEQIGEASIQTVLALTFIINNHDDIAKFDRFLGVPFPISIVSLVFSVISLLFGLFKLSNLLYQYMKKE